MRKFWRLCVLFIPLTINLFASDVKPVENAPVHEAFIIRAVPDILLQAIQEKPPHPILEKIPPQIDPQTVWVPGYFQWDESFEDFIWITGVWRRPPPGHMWIKGFWKEYKDGWVRIPGFWSPLSENDLKYIPVSPPSPMDEKAEAPQNAEFFWDPGYWLYDESSSGYGWVSGRWVPFDPNWILIPAHYVWRPEGYIFIPAFWDWPLDQIGTAFGGIFIDHDDRIDFVYTPSIALQEAAIIERCLPYYPDYLCYFQYHLHFHPKFWVDYCCTPPWWAWDTWWCFNWHNQWSLWWWYTHPGFPQPVWMDAKLANRLPRPTGKIYRLFRHTKPPVMITRRGIGNVDRIENSIRSVTNRSIPVIPANRDARNQIFHDAMPSRPSGALRPSGVRQEFNPRIPLNEQPLKPTLTTKERVRTVPERVVPRIPRAPQIRVRPVQSTGPERIPDRSEQELRPELPQRPERVPIREVQEKSLYPSRRIRLPQTWPDTKTRMPESRIPGVSVPEKEARSKVSNIQIEREEIKQKRKQQEIRIQEGVQQKNEIGVSMQDAGLIGRRGGRGPHGGRPQHILHPPQNGQFKGWQSNMPPPPQGGQFRDGQNNMPPPPQGGQFRGGVQGSFPSSTRPNDDEDSEPLA